MLSIRMQRTGRSGHAQFRLVVQDSRFHPTSGRVVAYVGNYNPHTKIAVLDGQKISKYLQSGAQPSDRVAKLLSKEGIKLPDWFTLATTKTGTVRNAAKRRSTRPPEEKGALPAEAEAPVSMATVDPTESPPAGETAVQVEAPTNLSAEGSTKAEEISKSTQVEETLLTTNEADEPALTEKKSA